MIKGRLPLAAAARVENRACQAVVEEFRAWLAQQGTPEPILKLCDEIRDRIKLRELFGEPQLPVREIRDALVEFYATEAEVTQWLHSGHRLLGGATPFERIQAGHADEVLALIDQLRSGAFV